MASIPDLKPLLDNIVDELRPSLGVGEVAGYIPELAKISKNKLAIAVATVDGRVVHSGDALERFSIQSISKVFTLALALGKVGDGLWRRVGREPSGTAFNSIVQLEHDQGMPRNPFVNAGAIVVADVILAGHQPREAIGEILRFIQSVAEDDTIVIDPDVARSETITGFRNVALANFMRSFGNIRHATELTLGVYFHQCAIAMSCCQLARAGLFLANGGRSPYGRFSFVSQERARRINAIMLTCGHYDDSGDFAYRVGLPGKSGVGGGVLAIAPGLGSVAAWSPALNKNGNSILATRALEMLAERTGWSVFSA